MKVKKKKNPISSFEFIEIFKQLLPEEHLLRYLSKEIRPDDRKFTESRNLKIIMG